MKYNLVRRPIELPPERLYLVTVPGGIEHLQYKEPTKIIGQHADTKEDRVGFKLPAGHPLHPETDLDELFDPILTVLASLIVPPKNLLGRFVPVCHNGFVPHRRVTIVKKVNLVRTTYHNQVEGMTRVIHAVYRLGDMAVLIGRSVVLPDTPDLLHHRAVKVRAHGISDAMIMAVLQKPCLVGGAVGT